MARYTNDIQTSKKPDEIVKETTDYLTKEGFKKTGDAWKKGMGIMTGPQWLKIETAEGKVHLEAWTQFALIPGVYLGEMGITGAVGAIPKRQLRKRVETVEALIKVQKNSW